MYNTSLIDQAIDNQKKASQRLVDCIETETDHGRKKITLFVRSVRGENKNEDKRDHDIVVQ